MVKPNEENEEMVKEENPRKSFQRKLDKLKEEKEKAQADAEYWKNEYYRAYASVVIFTSMTSSERMKPAGGTTSRT